MSKVTGLLVLKFVITLIVVILSLGLLARNPTWWLITIAIITTIINFLIGDLLILLTLGNIIASVMDGIMAAVTAYALDSLIQGIKINFLGLFSLALLITIGEYFFHLYLLHFQKNEQ